METEVEKGGMQDIEKNDSSPEDGAAVQLL